MSPIPMMLDPRPDEGDEVLALHHSMATDFQASLGTSTAESTGGIGPRLYVGPDTDVFGGSLDVIRMIEKKLSADPFIYARGIHMTLEKNVLTLSGWVASDAQRDLVALCASRTARSVGEPVRIVNRLRLVWEGLKEIGW